MVISELMSGITGAATVSIVIKAHDQYSKELEKATTNLDKFKVTAIALGKSTALAMAAFGAASINAAIQSKPIEDSFKRLADNSDVFLKSLQETTKGTISNFELMENSNKALLLGLEQSKLPVFFKNAIILGNAMGRTASEAIQDITLGIGRQSKLILDNLGILVNAETAYDQYAQKIGKVTSALTENEKQTAFTEAALAALNERARQLGGEIPDTVISKWSQVMATFHNFQVEVGNELLPVMSELLNVLVENKDAIKAVGDVILYFVKGVSFSIRIVKELGLLQGAVNDRYTNFYNLQMSGVGIIDSYNMSLDMTVEKYNRLRDETFGVTEETVKQGNAITGNIPKIDNETRAIMNNTNAQVANLNVRNMSSNATERLAMYQTTKTGRGGGGAILRQKTFERFGGVGQKPSSDNFPGIDALVNYAKQG